MRKMYNARLLFVLAMIISASSVTYSQDNRGYSSSVKRSSERAITKKKEVRIREPRVVRKARKKQEAKENKLKKEYEAFLKENRKRAYEIQSPEVKERMKANRKETKLNYKEKKKRMSKTRGKAGKK